MTENIVGLFFLVALIVLIIIFYLKNKKEGKDDYSGMNDGSGNIS
ncbi:MAG: hypothetical protein VXW96_01390 [Bacteroidota bacterium]|nr:hypothetical protein [Bacteroidota bacterium]MEC7619102.1 hypothetical protein [Bacteroidota bacterium]|tara:strand:- start:232 stop:366 length:135 start_codon:yes stop_codon:yes gene_type:complete